MNLGKFSVADFEVIVVFWSYVEGNSQLDVFVCYILIVQLLAVMQCSWKRENIDFNDLTRCL